MLFDSICNSRWFAQTAMILFLNKQDVFTARVPVSSITSHFPDYEGTRVPSILLLRFMSECFRWSVQVRTGDPHDPIAGQEYFRARFLRLNRSTSKEICEYKLESLDPTEAGA